MRNDQLFEGITVNLNLSIVPHAFSDSAIPDVDVMEIYIANYFVSVFERETEYRYLPLLSCDFQYDIFVFSK